MENDFVQYFADMAITIVSFENTLPLDKGLEKYMYHDVIWQKKYLPQEIFCDMVNTLCRIFAGFLQNFSSVLKNEELMQKIKIVISLGCIVFFTSRKRKWVFILLLPQMGPLLSHDALIEFVLYHIIYMYISV